MLCGVQVQVAPQRGDACSVRGGGMRHAVGQPHALEARARRPPTAGAAPAAGPSVPTEPNPRRSAWGADRGDDVDATTSRDTKRNRI